LTATIIWFNYFFVLLSGNTCTKGKKRGKRKIYRKRKEEEEEEEEEDRIFFSSNEFLTSAFASFNVNGQIIKEKYFYLDALILR
jgi:hypothetical protein